MNDRLRYVAGGAALGAVVGALAGLIVARSHGPEPAAEGERAVPAKQRELDTGRIFRLGASVIGVVRQILELA
ncbi:MAG: hypothetical protein JXA74_02870 [Anaerolineae bacterium]|nr:hypothetical protein [Anaerolineae bacterium]